MNRSTSSERRARPCPVRQSGCQRYSSLLPLCFNFQHFFLAPSQNFHFSVYTAHLFSHAFVLVIRILRILIKVVPNSRTPIITESGSHSLLHFFRLFFCLLMYLVIFFLIAGHDVLGRRSCPTQACQVVGRCGR